MPPTRHAPPSYTRGNYVIISRCMIFDLEFDNPLFLRILEFTNHKINKSFKLRKRYIIPSDICSNTKTTITLSLSFLYLFIHFNLGFWGSVRV